MRTRRKFELMGAAICATIFLCLFNRQFPYRLGLHLASTKQEQLGIQASEEAVEEAEIATSSSQLPTRTFSASLAVMTTTEPITSTPLAMAPDQIIVIGKLAKEDTAWVKADLPNWQAAIYTVDDPSAPLHTEKNKGNEANAYLYYIVQNYHSLASTIVFLHSHRGGYPVAWHNDVPSHDAVDMVNRLNVDFIQRNGYANLRCNPDPGCPAEVQPFRDPPEDHRTIEAAMPAAWEQLFNNTDVPRILATPCCGQFAVSKDQVLKRPLDDYLRYYRWLMETPLEDATSGRVFEYLWHIIFGKDPVYCPPAKQCYAELYG